MPFYNRLLEETAGARAYLLAAPIIREVFERRFTVDTYIAFLNQAYHHVRHTAPLLMLAGANLSEQQAWMRQTIFEYVNEEFGHEAWILDDLAACGCNREEYAVAPPPFSTEVLVAYLYDFITRKNPVGIFGMVLVLEGTSSSLAPAVAQIVQSTLNLPNDAMKYLTTHGALDQDHITYFEGVMNSITNEQDQRDIIHVANAVYQLYGDVYRSLPAAANSAQASRAA